MLDEMSLIFSDYSPTFDKLSQMLDELSKVTFGVSCHFARVVTLDGLSVSRNSDELSDLPVKTCTLAINM